MNTEKENAFITAYQDGNRVSLASVGATMVNKNSEKIPDTNLPVNVINKNLLLFKVQVGIYLNLPPADFLIKYETIKEGVQKEKTFTGLTKYTVGAFNDYESALKLKNNIINNYGIKDAFIIASFNNKYITLQEALELLK